MYAEAFVTYKKNDWLAIYNFDDLQGSDPHSKPERKILFSFFIDETVISEKLRDAIMIPQPVHCSFFHISLMGTISPVELLYFWFV